MGRPPAARESKLAQSERTTDLTSPQDEVSLLIEAGEQLFFSLNFVARCHSLSAIGLKKSLLVNLIYGIILVIMNTLAFYELLKRVPGTTKGEARAVANSIAHADSVATKEDLKVLEAKITEKLTWRIFTAIAGATVLYVALTAMMLRFFLT